MPQVPTSLPPDLPDRVGVQALGSVAPLPSGRFVSQNKASSPVGDLP